MHVLFKLWRGATCILRVYLLVLCRDTVLGDEMSFTLSLFQDGGQMGSCYFWPLRQDGDGGVTARSKPVTVHLVNKIMLISCS